MDSLISITFYDAKIENPPLCFYITKIFLYCILHHDFELFFLKSTRRIKMYCSLCLNILSFTLFNV